jgi:hypothetical protein
MKKIAADRRPSQGDVQFNDRTATWSMTVAGLGVLHIRMETTEAETGRVGFRASIDETAR